MEIDKGHARRQGWRSMRPMLVDKDGDTRPMLVDKDGDLHVRRHQWRSVTHARRQGWRSERSILTAKDGDL